MSGFAKMPILSFKWYPRKKPVLQIRILDLVALQGEISKTKATREIGSYYADVSDGFKALLKAHLIEHFSSRFTSHRPEKCYSLTERGLEVFINESSSPKECWIAIIWFSILHRKQKDDGNFEKYWHFLKKKHSANSSVGGGHFQLHIFDRLFKKFLSDNGYDNQEHGVTNAQRVLECLAVNRSITLEEIVQKIREQQEQFAHEEYYDDVSWSSEPENHEQDIISSVKVKNIINKYQYSTTNYNTIQNRLEGHNPDELMEKYLNVLTQMIIVKKNDHDDSSAKYELSLVGVTLVIALVRYVYVENAEVQNLLYYDMHPIDYYDKIAANYQDKLPLIFKKWNLLRDRSFFDILVYHESRGIFTHVPFYMGGNKELYDGIKAAASYSNDKYNEIYQGGMAALRKMDYLDSDKKEKYLAIISKKLSEIEVMLKYADLRLLADTIQSDLSGSYKYKQKLETIEKILAEELTLLLYLGQRTAALISIVEPSMFMDSARCRNNSLISQSDELLRFAMKDKDVRTWLSDKIKDSWKYQKQAIENISHRYEKITGQKLE
jgi:hypothetical protein